MRKRKKRDAVKNINANHFYTFSLTYINKHFMAGIAKLFHGHILNKSNEEINLNDEKYKGKTIGLYFSAHWYV